MRNLVVRKPIYYPKILKMEEKLKAFERLLIIMDELREKCPWDKKQTIESLRHLTIEETYELADAIIDKDMLNIKKELGDVLLHIVFYARIASETNEFDIADVINSLCEKLISRHPHIYGDVKVENEQDVKENWEKLKLKEGNKSVLGGVPNSLPSLIKASRIQEKARAVGFDWEKPEQVWEKVQEEIAELKHEVDSGAPVEKMEGEFGDVLFSLINYARFVNINPEDALEKTNKKFIKRFQYLENEAQKAGKQLSDMTLAEMDVYWNKAKEL
jgi:XTP/dITP diphosphohydrolase